MIARLIAIPGKWTWIYAFITLVLFAMAWVQWAPADTFDSKSAEAIGIVTGKDKSQNASGQTLSRPTPSISYAYSAPAGRQYNASSPVSSNDWRDLQPGHLVNIRYLISNPESHRLQLRDHSTDADTLMTFGWIMSIAALFRLFFDLRRAFPLPVKQIGTTACLFAYVGLISIAGGALLRWHELKEHPGFVITEGHVSKMETRPGQRATPGETTAPAQPQTWISYMYQTQTGKQEFSRMVSNDFGKSLGKGDRIIVLHRSHDSREHHIKSAKSLEAAEGWYIIGWMLWAMALIIFLWRVFVAYTTRTSATNRR